MDYITTSNLYWNRFELEVIKQMPFADKDLERCVITKGDLLVCEGGDIGRAAIWNYDYDICIQNHIHRLRGKLQLCNLFYYYVFYEYKLTNRISSKGTTIQGLSSKEIDTLLIPLPPLAEQKRIVAEIEKWFALIDELDANKQDLQVAIRQVRAKVLDLAIHGKLVPQDPNDEPAIALLRRINPHYTPSDTSHYQNIPNGWEVCRLENVFEIVMGSSPNGSSLNTQKQGVEFHQGKICFTDMYLLQSDTYTNAPTKFAEPKSVLLCVRAPVGVVNLTDRKICIGRGLCALKPRQGIDLLFGFYALQTHKDHFDEQATGTTFKAIGGNTIRCEEFLLPPYNEQVRIRERIETILQQLDTISVEL